MLELVFVIIIIGMFSYYALQKKNDADFYNSVNSFLTNVDNILNNAVMDTVTGYVNGTGGDCSNDNSYTDLSAGKAIDCVGWSTTYPYDGIKDDDGKDSYIVGLLKNYTVSGSGCKIYLDDIASDEYYVFFDCSNINREPIDRYKKYIEDKLIYNITSNFSTIYQSVDRDSTAIDNDSGGNDHDGKIRFKMKK